MSSPVYKVHFDNLVNYHDFTLGNPNNVVIPKGARIDKNLRESIELLSYDANNMVSFRDLEYTPDILRTYKFMGMDIDDSLRAVIKSSSGSFICGSIYDMDVYKKICENSNNISIESVKRLITGLKEGGMYELYKGLEKDSDGVLSSFTQRLVGLIFKDNSLYKSVILSLIKSGKIKNTDENDSSDEFYKNLQVVSVIFSHISDLIRRYNTLQSNLSAMDLFIRYESQLSGEDITRSKMNDLLDIRDNKGNKADMAISFSGISKNESLLNGNILRDSNADLCGSISHHARSNFAYFGDVKNFKESVKVAISTLHDTDGIDDVYSMSPEENQALSILDGLQCVDDDAILCKESYDMNDPEDRGLFVKSAIRSYERNFSEFKPSVNYEVTEALAEMVDRGDILGNKQKEVSIDSVSPDSEDTNGIVVTSTDSEIHVSDMKNSLIRVAKLVNKCSDKVLSGFA